MPPPPPPPPSISLSPTPPPPPIYLILHILIYILSAASSFSSDVFDESILTTLGAVLARNRQQILDPLKGSLRISGRIKFISGSLILWHLVQILVAGIH